MAGFSVQVIRIRSRAGTVELRSRFQRGVERDGHSWCFPSVGVNPVIQPARKYHKQPGLRSNPKRLPVRVAWRSHGINARPRIEELQDTTERLIRALGSGIHVVHTGPCTVRMRVGRMVCPARQIVAHAEVDSVPLNALAPAVASIIWRRAQVSHAVSADTAGSRRLRKSGRECHPPMLLRPRLGYCVSSAMMSACKS